jgi:insulysin
MSRLVKTLLLAILVLQIVFFSVQGKVQILSEDTHIPILSPSLAGRQTEKIQLSNGLEAYIISDPQAVQAGAALSVQAGSWDDPKEFPGLAHFLEHMLFLGTEKYPNASEYDRFIHANDGEMNAYTTTDHTLYLFSVTSGAFEEALDRFSYFFKKPLFNPAGIDREMHAVDQEFEKNTIQNGFRELQVQKELGNPDHPFHQFSGGNISTLAKVTQEDLRKWYNEHYSANKMKLIVYGPQSIAQMQKWVDANFKEVPSHTVQSTPLPSSILDKQMAGKMVYIYPKQNARTLRLTWELSSLLSSSKSMDVLDAISGILYDERPGTLLGTLKSEGLAIDVNSTKERLAKDSLLFSINVNLTKKGLDDVQNVIERVFQYVRTLQATSFPYYLSQEALNTSLLKYQYQSRGETFEYLMSLGGMLVYENISSFPERSILPDLFDFETYQHTLDQLSPEQTYFSIISHQAPITFDRVESWMKVPYAVKDIPKEQMQTWTQATPLPSFSFPPPNPFIPKNFDLVSSSEMQDTASTTIPTPIVLVDNPQAKIYFAADHRFQLPQSEWFFEIKTPAITLDPSTVVLTDLYLNSVEESLRNIDYPLQEAGLSYHLARTSNGITLSLFGFSDKMEPLFTRILDAVQLKMPSEKSFESLKPSLFGRYANMNGGNPLQQGFEIYQTILHSSSPTEEQLLSALEKTTYLQFNQFVERLYNSTYTQGLFYGNITEEKASLIWQKLETALNSSKAYPESDWYKEQTLPLPVKNAPLAIEINVPTPAHAAILAVEECYFSFKSRAAQEILSQAISSAFYTTLRTKQQTGYLTQASGIEVNKNYYTFFSVQSSTHDPRDLLARFELFIESFLDDMSHGGFTPENFKLIRDTLLENLENSPQNMVEMGSLLKNLAFKYEGDFEWIAKRKQGFKDLTYDEFLSICKEFLGKENKRRMAVLIRGKSDKDFHYESISTNPDNVRQAIQ